MHREFVQSMMSLVGTAFTDQVCGSHSTDLGILGISMVPDLDDVEVSTAAYVLPPSDGVNLLSGKVEDPAVPTAVGECGMVRVHVPVPHIQLLRDAAYPRGAGVDTPLLFLFHATRLEDTYQVTMSKFSTPVTAPYLLNSSEFPLWAMSKTS